jgi:hypothetical protein
MPDAPPKSKDLTRDDRIKILILKEIGWTHTQIVTHFNIIARQVQYACERDHSTSFKCSDRSAVLFTEQQQNLIQYVTAFFENRCLIYSQLAAKFDWNVSY